MATKPFPPFRFHGPTKQHYFWDRVKKDRHNLGRDEAKAKKLYDQFKADYDARAKREADPPPIAPGDAPTVSDVLIRYIRHRKKEGATHKDLNRLKTAVRFARRFCGLMPAAQFRAQKLRDLRGVMLKAKSRRRIKAVEERKAYRKVTPLNEETPTLARTYVNRLVSHIRCAWIWAVGEDLIPGDSGFVLQAVKGLRKGSGGREVPRITDVEDWVVEATLPELNPTVAAMVRLQQLAGMRPGELCNLRRRDISISPKEKVQLPETRKFLAASDSDGTLVWLAIPESHKTLWRGTKPRVITLGPLAQAILGPFIEGREPDDFLFSPKLASDAWRIAKERKPTYGKGREPGDCYTTSSYGRSVAYAIERINRQKKHGEEPLPPWRPNQLRHSAATAIAERYDRPTAAAVLGHSGLDVIDIYCEQELKKSARVAAAMG
jgi:integrase